ncbi:MAG: hypothetical protein IPP39_05340 [Chitinophagaceae bacterium]|nr:hypothetical protein [Chitinophagaceae bacterium]
MTLELIHLLSPGTATGSAISYVKTSGTSGGLQLLGVTTLRTVPVGNSTYNPITIANGSSLNWTVRVEDLLAVADPTYQPNIIKAVKREWHITPSTVPLPAGVDLVFQWDVSDPTQIGASYINTENVQMA